MKNSAILAAFATILFLGWLCRNLNFLSPYEVLIVRKYGFHVLGSVAAVWVSFYAGFYAILGDDSARSLGRRLAEVNQRFKNDELPVRRGQ